jgi:hypothetical protein
LFLRCEKKIKPTAIIIGSATRKGFFVNGRTSHSTQSAQSKTIVISASGFMRKFGELLVGGLLISIEFNIEI